MLVDQKLVMHDKQSVASSGNNYGDNVVESPMEQDGSGFNKLVVVVTGSFGGAGTTKISLCGDDSSNTPTTIVQPIFEGSASELVAGKTIRVGITPDAVKKYSRCNVNNSTAAAGGAIMSYLAFD